MDTEAPLKKDILSPVPGRPEDLTPPARHEERLEWVRQSCERFFEKVRDNDVFLLPAELN